MDPQSERRILSDFKYSYIFLDTTCLFDSIRHPDKFTALYSLLHKAECTLLTIEAVITEYYKGSSGKEDLKKKKEAIDEMLLTVVPTSHEIAENAIELASIYGRDGKDVSATDFYLGGCLVKYQNSETYLMTRDHRAFPESIFDRVLLIPVGYNREVHVLGLYKFNLAKYNSRTKKLLTEGAS